MSFLRGAEFVARAQLTWHKPVERRMIEIPLEGETLKAYKYGENRRGAVLIVHGMTLRGIDDPRMDNLGRAFASLGFAAYAPLFPEVAALKISEGSSARIAQAGRWVSVREKERIAIFSASFSAGLSLVAACRDLADQLTAVCTIGTLGSADTTLEFLMGQEGIDDYGTLIVLWNFIGMPDRVRTALLIAAADNGLERAVPELPAFLLTMTQEERDLFHRFRNDRAFRLKEWHGFASTQRYRDLHAQISPLPHVKPVPFRTVLIHGEEDNVIPASESVALRDAFDRAGSDVHALTTPLISHGHGSMGPSAALHAARLASAFGAFLSAAADSSRKRLQ
jgi:dienelactone hydrolase